MTPSPLLLATLAIAALPPAAPALAAEPAEQKTRWVTLIGQEGPVGIEKVGKSHIECGDVRLGSSAKQLTAQPGKGTVAALSKLAYGDDRNLHSKREFGDCKVSLEFLIAKGSNSGVKLQGRYEIQLYDSAHKEKPTATECGGIYPHWKFRDNGQGLEYIDEGYLPKLNAAKPAGEWQTLRIVFRAPRFNEQGKKTENARFVSVVLNDKTIHEQVEVDSPTGNASTPLPEVAQAPLMLQLDHGAVAFRNVRVKPLEL